MSPPDPLRADPSRGDPSRAVPLILGPQEIHVWSFSLDEPPRGQRREFARRWRSAILGRYLGVPAAAVTTTRLPGGKPTLADTGSSDASEIEFNLSHSGTLAALAVARSLPVGIDLEAERNSIDLARGIRDRCTAREGRWVRAADQPHNEWVRLWTRKEAVVKATGDGVLDQLAQIDVLEEVVVASDGALTGSWRCLDLVPPAPGFHLALALPDVPGVRVVQRQVDSLDALDLPAG